MQSFCVNFVDYDLLLKKTTLTLPKWLSLYLGIFDEIKWELSLEIFYKFST